MSNTDALTSTIFHIGTRTALTAARQSGHYRAPSLDSEGFIHFSQAHQVRAVLEVFYAGQPDLVLLVVDAELLTAPLRYEPPATLLARDLAAATSIAPDQLFPHLYGPLNTEAIVDTVDPHLFAGGPVHDTVPARER
ncbi:DUF952 domain-containing protein [Comamonadaceae bacterium G21597-S1]|nr:DUF952 domain-containing protein [Comamonadaceae bacterium G21597-S1]